MPAFYYQVTDDVNNYFSRLNPIAEKIATDIEETKSTYGQFWYTLNQNEKNEIIDDTLIKPEITLKYYNNACEMSIDSSYNDTTAETNGQLQIDNSIIESYAFDGRNLKTYTMQKVALKKTHDDTLISGSYHRDEHSAPFSYRTRSQINLMQTQNSYEATGKTENTIYALQEHANNKKKAQYKPNIQLAANYKKLQSEMKKNVCNSESNVAHSTFDADQNIIIVSKPPAVNPKMSSKTVIINAIPPSTTAVRKFKLTGQSNKKNELNSHSFGNSTKSPSAINYAVYADNYSSSGEQTNLMQQFDSNSQLMASSSSIATSDEEDEKTLCEDVKLLIKGFDFLNNW